MSDGGGPSYLNPVVGASASVLVLWVAAKTDTDWLAQLAIIALALNLIGLILVISARGKR